MGKAPEAFRTISEVAEELDVPKHVLRFWETRFTQVKPMKRGGGRRYYRPEDVDLLRGIRTLLHDEGYTIRGLQRVLRTQGVNYVKNYWRMAASHGTSGQRHAHPSVPDLAGEAAGHARKAALQRARAAPKDSPRKPARAPRHGAASPAGDDASEPARFGPVQRRVLEDALAELQQCRELLASHGLEQRA